MMESISFKDLSIEEIHKEIDLIQSCISKMANNSFLIKGWLITLISIAVEEGLKTLGKMEIFR